MKTVKLLTGILAFTTFAVRLKAQHSLPVLRANTVSIDVREGKNFYKGYWSASPSVKKDVYYAHRFTLSNNITFISDVDSVSFHLQPGKTYPFIILLNGRDSCYTEISTIRQTYHKQPGQAVNTDSIPFTIGQDGRIYIDGTVNHSAPLRFFFDNGADNTIVFPSAFKKGLQLVLDDSVQNNATGGTTMRGTSNSAIVQLGLMQWDNEMAMYVSKQLGDSADGTIGYDLFEDKVVEINYDKMVLIMHSRPISTSGYEKFDMVFNGNQVPAIKVILHTGDSTFEKYFTFDMGATGCLLINRAYALKHSLYNILKPAGKSISSGAGTATEQTEVAILPGLQLGKYTLKNAPVYMPSRDGHGDGGAEIGMDVLKKFNAILDFQNNIIYLKANRLFNLPYRFYKRQAFIKPQ